MRKTKRIFTLLTSSILILLCTLVLNANNNELYAAELEEDFEDGILIDTTTMRFFLDGKKTSAMATLGKLEGDSVKYVGGNSNPKDAILQFGEKARYGIMLFETK